MGFSWALWEYEPLNPYYGVMNGEHKNFQTGMASEFLVVSMLYRLGAQNVCLTLGNAKKVDIIMLDENGEITKFIDVKSVRATYSIPMGNISKKNFNDKDFFVFVIYNHKFGDVSCIPDFYIVPGKVVKENIHEFNGGRYNIFKSDIKDYKDKWELLKKNDNNELQTD